jgi:hypothetical protein
VAADLPANATVAQTLQLHAEPRGWRMFAALSGRHARDLGGQNPVSPAVIDRRRDGFFHGAVDSPQRFVGLANAGIGGGTRAVHERAGEIGDSRSANFDDGPLRVFRERQRRRR